MDGVALGLGGEGSTEQEQHDDGKSEPPGRSQFVPARVSEDVSPEGEATDAQGAKWFRPTPNVRGRKYISCGVPWYTNFRSS